MSKMTLSAVYALTYDVHDLGLLVDLVIIQVGVCRNLLIFCLSVPTSAYRSALSRSRSIRLSTSPSSIPGWAVRSVLVESRVEEYDWRLIVPCGLTRLLYALHDIHSFVSRLFLTDHVHTRCLENHFLAYWRFYVMRVPPRWKPSYRFDDGLHYWSDSIQSMRLTGGKHLMIPCAGSSSGPDQYDSEKIRTWLVGFNNVGSIKAAFPVLQISKHSRHLEAPLSRPLLRTGEHSARLVSRWRG